MSLGLGSTSAPIIGGKPTNSMAGLIGVAAFGTSVFAAFKGKHRMRSGLRAFSAVALTMLYLDQNK